MLLLGHPNTASRWLAMVGLVLSLVGVLCCGGSTNAEKPTSDPGGNLLHGLTPIEVVGVTYTERMSDGTVARDGDHWKTNLTSRLTSPRSRVVWDLGEKKTFGAAFLHGDNNDTYYLAVSDDNVTYRSLWRGGVIRRPGLQPRFAGYLRGEGRYIRLTASGGDGAYSVSELQLFSSRPAVFPPRLPAAKGTIPDEALRPKIVFFGVALALLAWLTRRKSPVWWIALVSVVPLIAAAVLFFGLREAWPLAPRELSLLRATVAGSALLVVLREALAPPRFPADRRTVIASLAVAGVIALSCFYNLGRPQFFDQKRDAPSYVHYADLRVYFPVAKYFEELRFDGLYMGSVAAYVDDDPNMTMQRAGYITLRDLRTHRMARVSDIVPDIEAIKARFSPERWEAFKTDMRYFREAMGLRDYLGTLHDHGGNATPVWLTVAHLLFANANASHTTMMIAGLLDPLLLLFMFGMIGRTFGLRTMFVSMVVFGANDFYMFGTNWAGATLRHDWMVALGLGACALKKEHWMLGGALLAWAALIRAFPALALVAVLFPAIWWLKEYRATHKAWPPLVVVRASQSALGRVILGALICVGASFLVSSLILSFGAWPAWVHKVSLLEGGMHVNHVSLRGLLDLDPKPTIYAIQHGTPHTRTLVWKLIGYFGGIIGGFALIIHATRNKKLVQAAVLGLLLIPVVFYPANYYIHFVFLIPLLVLEQHRAPDGTESQNPLTKIDGGIWAAVLAVCAAQYVTVVDMPLDKHFYYATVILFTCMTAMLAMMVASEQMARRAKLATDGEPEGSESAEDEKSPEAKAKPPDEAEAEEDLKDEKAKATDEAEPAESESKGPKAEVPDKPEPEEGDLNDAKAKPPADAEPEEDDLKDAKAEPPEPDGADPKDAKIKASDDENPEEAPRSAAESAKVKADGEPSGTDKEPDK